jgi:hypothetical protein
MISALLSAPRLAVVYEPGRIHGDAHTGWSATAA